MKRLVTLIAALVFVGTGAFAHEGNDHVRGVIIKITPEWHSITVRTTENVVRTLSITEKTTFKLGKKTVDLAALNVGDRVVIDVPVKTAQALIVEIGAAPAPATPARK